MKLLSKNSAYYSAVLGVFLVAAIWFILNASIWPITYDEVITILELSGGTPTRWADGIVPAAVHKQIFQNQAGFGEIIPTLKNTDVHPPLYYFLALAWKKYIGNDVTSIRMMSSLLVLTSGVVVYFCATQYGRSAKLVALVLFFGAPLTTWAAISARGYALALLFSCCTLYLASRTLVNESKQDRAANNRWLLFAATGLFGGLAFLSHYFTILFTVPLLACLALLRIRQQTGPVLLGASIFAICGILALPMLAAQLGARPHQLAGFTTFSTEIGAVTRMYLAMLAEPINSLWAYRFQFIFFLLLLIGSAIHGLWTVRKDQSGILYVGGLLGCGIAMVMLFFVTDKSFTGIGGFNKYGMFLLPVLAVLVGRTIVAAAKKSRILSSLISILLLIFIAATWKDGKIPTEPWLSGEVIFRLKFVLQKAPAEKSLVIVPRGYGRGAPGVWAHEIPDNVPMIVLKHQQDIERIKGRLADFDLIVVAYDKTGKLTPGLEIFRDTLIQSGFHKESDFIYRRDGNDK